MEWKLGVYCFLQIEGNKHSVNLSIFLFSTCNILFPLFPCPKNHCSKLLIPRYLSGSCMKELFYSASRAFVESFPRDGKVLINKLLDQIQCTKENLYIISVFLPSKVRTNAEHSTELFFENKFEYISVESNWDWQKTLLVFNKMNTCCTKYNISYTVQISVVNVTYAIRQNWLKLLQYTKYIFIQYLLEILEFLPGEVLFVITLTQIKLAMSLVFHALLL